AGVLAGGAAVARPLWLDAGVLVALTVFVYLMLRYPRRLVFRVPAALLGAAYVAAAVHAWSLATRAPLAWSIAGALSSVALLGSVTLAMTLGHWYLVVRGMAIDPLKRLTHATLAASIARLLIVAGALLAPGVWHELAIREGILFSMRALWGLLIPPALYPMVWGTVKIRSAM